MPVTLQASNELVEEVSLPADFAVALRTSRPELLALIHRSLNANETQMVAHAFGVLLRTNGELRAHSEELAQEIERLRSTVKGLLGSLGRTYDKARFRESLDSYDEI